MEEALGSMLTLCLLLLPPPLVQENHYTVNKRQFAKLQASAAVDDKVHVRVYPIKESSWDKGKNLPPESRPFVNVLNSGTPEFTDRMQEIVSSLKFQQNLMDFWANKKSRALKEGTTRNALALLVGKTTRRELMRMSASTLVPQCRLCWTEPIGNPLRISCEQ
jgi:hypothetical protein